MVERARKVDRPGAQIPMEDWVEARINGKWYEVPRAVASYLAEMQQLNASLCTRIREERRHLINPHLDEQVLFRRIQGG